jgi:Transposase IS4
VTHTKQCNPVTWCDSAVVNIISNADPSTIGEVTRLVGQTKTTFKAPTCISEYNQAMQGVDRIDQLRARFSIADGHTFKKWHKKLAMAFIDLARCNAYICRKLSGAFLDGRDPHREFVMNLSAELLNGEWKNALGDRGMFFSAPVNQQESLLSPRPMFSPGVMTPTRVGVECKQKHSKQVFPNSRWKRECVVCRFECRYPSEQTVFCFNHNAALCLKAYETSLPLFAHQEPDMTCWAKYHSFYFPHGLFNLKGNIRRSCDLFKRRKLSRIQPNAKERPRNQESFCVMLENIASGENHGNSNIGAETNASQEIPQEIPLYSADGTNEVVSSIEY